MSRPTAGSRRLNRTMLWCGAIGLAVVACGAPRSSGVRDISDAPAGLLETTMPPTTPPPSVESTAPPTTEQSGQVLLFYVLDDARPRLAPVPEAAPLGISTAGVLDLLAAGPKDSSGRYRSVVPPDAIVSVTIVGDLAEIVLSRSVDQISSRDDSQKLAIGQIVLTVLYRDSLQGVRFFSEDGRQGKSVPLGDGSDSGADRVLERGDYLKLLGEDPEPVVATAPPTSPPPTATGSSAPPSSAAKPAAAPPGTVPAGAPTTPSTAP